MYIAYMYSKWASVDNWVGVAGTDRTKLYTKVSKMGEDVDVIAFTHPRPKEYTDNCTEKMVIISHTAVSGVGRDSDYDRCTALLQKTTVYFLDSDKNSRPANLLSCCDPAVSFTVIAVSSGVIDYHVASEVPTARCCTFHAPDWTAEHL
jgi:hypothetical protein